MQNNLTASKKSLNDKCPVNYKHYYIDIILSQWIYKHYKQLYIYNTYFKVSQLCITYKQLIYLLPKFSFVYLYYKNTVSG